VARLSASTRRSLAADPALGQCGWLTDRFGLSWQIVPQMMMDLLPLPDSPGKQRLMTAMMGMRKLDIAALQQAFAQP
jgi:predicted 3-demethylubiquinone-9 3-methyltransferase (glyoxalase superfamily)